MLKALRFPAIVCGSVGDEANEGWEVKGADQIAESFLICTGE